MLRPSPAVLLVRDLAGAARGLSLYSVRGATTLVGGLLAWGFLHHLSDSTAEAGQVAGWLFKATEGLQLTLCLLIPPLRGLGTIVQERRQATWDLLALTRLGTVRAALGKILAVVTHQLALVLGLAPIQIVAGCYGGVGAWDLVWLLVAIVDLSILGAALGVACGLAGRKAGGGAGWLALMVLGVYGVGAGIALSWADRQNYNGTAVLRAFAAAHPAGVMFLAIPAPFPEPWEGLLVGLPLQAALYLAAALVLARRSQLRGKGAGTGRNVLRGPWRRPALAALLCLGFPFLVILGTHAFGKADVLGTMWRGDGRLWVVWLGTTAAFMHVVGPMLLATPLARERELGTMPLLLMLPRPPATTYLAPVRALLLFDALVLLGYHAIHAVASSRCPPTSGFDDFPEFAAGMGLASAASALWPAAVVLLASSLVSSTSKASTGFVAVMLWLQLTPLLAFFLLRLLDAEELAERLPYLCSLSSISSEASLASVLGFGAAGVLTFAVGARFFERLQRRFPVVP